MVSGDAEGSLDGELGARMQTPTEPILGAYSKAGGSHIDQCSLNSSPRPTKYLATIWNQSWERNLRTRRGPQKEINLLRCLKKRY